MFLIRMLKTMFQMKCYLLYNNLNILILLIILPCGLSHKETRVKPDDNYYIQHHKLPNRAKNVLNRLPVGDIIIYDNVDDNQPNFHKLSKHSDGKFNNQPILHNFDRIQQRHQTTHMADDKFMNRQLSHKHWGSKRSHKSSRNPKRKTNRYKHLSENRTYGKGLMRYHANGDKNARAYRKSSYSHSFDKNSKHYSNGRLVQKFQDEYEPPYIKKYNRRNKQLLNLLEGTLSFDETAKPKQHSSKMSHKTNRWVETNLFEEQRPTRLAQNVSKLYDTNNELNEVPGEIDSGENSYEAHSKEPPNRNPSKSEKFNYHRIASPKLVGFGSFGMLKKQQLPFVAITDKRLTHSNGRAYSQQPSNLSMP